MTTNRLHFCFSAARLQRYVAVLLFSLFAAAPLGAVEDVRFRNITMEDGLHSNTVRNIVQDRYGFIWMGSDNGLSRYDGHEIRSFHILDNGLDQYVSALLAVSDGLYVGTSQGVWFFDFRTESFQRIVSQLNATVFSFAADRDSNIWIGSGRHCQLLSSFYSAVATVCHQGVGEPAARHLRRCQQSGLALLWQTVRDADALQ